MPFYRALVEFQGTATTGGIRAQLIRGNAWCALMDRLHSIHAKGQSLVHPKIVKLLEVRGGALVDHMDCPELWLHGMSVCTCDARG